MPSTSGLRWQAPDTLIGMAKSSIDRVTAPSARSKKSSWLFSSLSFACADCDFRVRGQFLSPHDSRHAVDKWKFYHSCCPLGSGRHLDCDFGLSQRRTSLQTSRHGNTEPEAET